MDFDFSEEQYLFQDTFNSFLTEKHALDRYMQRLEDAGVDEELWSQLTELGLFSLLVPESYGGVGLGFVDLALILEELGKALVPPPAVETIVCADMIGRYGTDAQKEQFLPAVAEGRLRIVPALMEEHSGFDPDCIATTLTPHGGDWILTGNKILVPHSATADLIMVLTRMGAGGELGIVLLQPGSVSSLREHSTLDESCRFHELTMQDVAVKKEDVLGDGPAAAMIDCWFDALTATAAIHMIGVASKVLDLSVSYASDRVQFGKAIGSFQAIKHKCADMAVAIDGGRSAAYYAAWAVANDSPDRAKAVSIAKSFCGDTARMVCNEGIQIHGGMGFTWELGLHYYLRRTKVLEYSYGDASYHRERVISAALSELATET